MKKREKITLGKKVHPLKGWWPVCSVRDREKIDEEQESRLKREKAQEAIEEKTRYSQYLSLKEEFEEKE